MGRGCPHRSELQLENKQFDVSTGVVQLLFNKQGGINSHIDWRISTVSKSLSLLRIVLHL